MYGKRQENRTNTYTLQKLTGLTMVGRAVLLENKLAIVGHSH